MAYGLGLMGFLGVKILVPGFSAREDLMTPARFGVYAVVVNLVLSLLLAIAFAPAGWAHAGLALAASLASLVNAGLLLTKLAKLKVYRPQAGFGGFLSRVLLANIAMGVLLLFPAGQSSWANLAASARVLNLALWIGLSIAAYVLTLVLAGLRPRHLLLPHGV
jgi:putative peptidoglycan lipid II flippase